MGREYLTANEVKQIERYLKMSAPVPVHLAKVLYEAYCRKRDMVNELEDLLTNKEADGGGS